MQSLPPELWLLIASNLSQSDLAYLSLASSQLLHIIRPHLYRSVNLEANPYTSHTLALLARDKELARCVIELMLSRRSGFGLAANVVPYQEPSLVNVAALENLITLKRITLLGRIFCTTVEQSQFGRTLANIPLEEFTCIASAKDGPWPSDQLEGIRDLKKFVWQKDDRLLDPMWGILSRSRETVHTLSFPSMVFDRQSYHRLWSMHFPHLRSLTLGVWVFDPGVLDGNTLSTIEPKLTDLTDFVLAHNTIEELDMDYSEYDDFALTFNRTSLSRLREDSLPRLRSFRGNSLSLTTMAQARMKCLGTTLQTLIVGPGRVVGSRDKMQCLFNALLSPNAGVVPSALKDINIDISPWHDNNEELDSPIEAIRLCARCWGSSLEVWRGTLSSGIRMKAEDLGNAFGLFERLRVIHLDIRTILGYEGDVVASYLCVLASRCRALEEVFVKHTTDLGEWWEVARAQTSGGDPICSVKLQKCHEIKD